MMQKTKARMGLFVLILLVLGMAIGMGITKKSTILAKAMTTPGYQNVHDIDLTGNGYSNIKYIPNANYFKANPKHFDGSESTNIVGSCTTIAMQMLMGYHNYYTDRRLIPEKILDGEKESILLSDHYGKYEDNPMFYIKPQEGVGLDTIGTEDGFYYELMSLNDSKGKDLLEQMYGPVTRAANSFVAKHASEIREQVSISWKMVGSTEAIKTEIDKGNPIIIGSDQLFNSDIRLHVLVAYGYANYNGTFGYITHFGYDDSEVEVWIPASWVGFKITMTVEHEHVLEDTGNDFEYALDEKRKNVYRELECNECGYTTIDPLYDLTEIKDGTEYEISRVRHPVSGNLTIPSSIDSIPITSIGDSVFENYKDLTAVSFSLPSKLTSIGKFAFRGCENLKKISIQPSTGYIGDGAFVGCTNLTFNVNPSNPHFRAPNNVLCLYDKTHNIPTEILHTGKIDSEITVENTVTRIAPHAFDGNKNLKKITFKGSPEIGDESFAHNINLQDLYFDSDVPPASVGAEIFSFRINVGIYVPYDVKDAYRTAFGEYGNRVFSQAIDVIFDGGEIRKETHTYYCGQTVTLPDWGDGGYSYSGWKDNNGNVYTGEYRISDKTPITFTTTLTPKTYIVTLNANGGVLSGKNTITVTYGENYFTDATVQRRGYKLRGWVNGDTMYLTAAGKSCVPWNKTSGITLYADWVEASYEVMFLLNEKVFVWVDEPLTISGFTVIYFGDKLSYQELSERFKQSDAGFKEGYIFSKFEMVEPVFEITNLPPYEGDMRRVAFSPVWEKERHTLRFHTDTDEIIEDVSAAFDEDIVLGTPSRRGYVFLHWEDSEGVVFNASKMPDLSPNAQNNAYKDLYAKWDAYHYSVAYNANGGSGGKYMTNTSFRYDEEKNLTVNDYYRTGYEFTGWARTAGGTVEFTDGQKVSNLTDEQNGYVMLYAIWKPATYSIICKNLATGWTASRVEFTYGVGTNEMPVIYTANIGGRYYTLETFEGWYTSTNFQTRVTRISSTQAGDVTVYAKYYISVENFTDSDTYQVTDDDDLNKQPYFEINFNLGSYQYERIKNTTLKSIRIEISLNIWEVDDGYQECFLFCGNTQIWEQTIEHGPGKKNGTPARYALNIPLFAIQDYASQDYFMLRFGARGFSKDTWRFNNLEVHVSLVNDA